MKTPWHLWLVGVIAVLFNAIGAFDHAMSARGASYMASAGMTPAQIAHYQEMPRSKKAAYLGRRYWRACA